MSKTQKTELFCRLARAVIETEAQSIDLHAQIKRVRLFLRDFSW
jgi:hypothetical protein